MVGKRPPQTAAATERLQQGGLRRYVLRGYGAPLSHTQATSHNTRSSGSAACKQAGWAVKVPPTSWSSLAEQHQNGCIRSQRATAQSSTCPVRHWRRASGSACGRPWAAGDEMYAAGDACWLSRLHLCTFSHLHLCSVVGINAIGHEHQMLALREVKSCRQAWKGWCTSLRRPPWHAGPATAVRNACRKQ